MKQTCMYAPSLVSKHFYPLWYKVYKSVPWDFSLEYFGSRLYWNAELKLVPLLSNQRQLLIQRYGSFAMLVKEKIFDIMAP